MYKTLLSAISDKMSTMVETEWLRGRDALSA